MPDFTIRSEDSDKDRIFIRGLNGRLSGVIDAPTHSKQEVEAFQDHFTATAWEVGAADGTTLVAVDKDGKQLGYIHVRESMDEIANEKCGYVALLAVVAEAEGAGVGDALLREAEQWTRRKGFRRLSLDVFASNLRGRRFYEKAGFRPETIRLIKQL